MPMSRSLVAPGDPAHQKLREEVLEHLWRYYPNHCVVLTDPRTRRAIDFGIERAARYGFRKSPDVCGYVGLMVFLGSFFDEDFQLPWARRILFETAELDRKEAIEKLQRKTVEELESVVGKRGGYYRRSLVWAGTQSFDALREAYDDSSESLRAGLAKLYRRKYEYLAEDTIDRLIETARGSARTYGLTAPPGTAVYLALMFLLGSFIDQDPFHPWAGSNLWEQTVGEPIERARRLHAESVDQLRRLTMLGRLMRGD